jgi:formiminotetrahydrofolate cyclodeaminase
MAANPPPLSSLVLPNRDTSLAAAIDAFASGHEVPGSGSANALVAALAAALIASVAEKTYARQELTKYRPISDAAKRIASRAKTRSHKLLELVDEDARAFAPVIALRREAKTLRDEYQQDQSIRTEIAATKPATEIPIEIAVVCIELLEDGFLMLDRGFAPAKGESYSAITALIAAADGALFVATLNVNTITNKAATLSDPGYEHPWLKSTKRSIKELRQRVSSYANRIESAREKVPLRKSRKQRAS